jgi:hypothetical protein
MARRTGESRNEEAEIKICSSRNKNLLGAETFSAVRLGVFLL